jgi:uncharacterized membrane protein YoaK (UPF0700 family)
VNHQQPPSSTAVIRPMPIALSFVAGYVDSCTYLALFGVFVAQVTGSFVLAGTQLVRSEPGALARLLAIPAFFLAGVTVTVLVHPLRQRPRIALACSLALECLLLIGFTTTSFAGMPFRGPDAPGAIVALLFAMAAMGAQSALVRLLMRGVASTNVMTTNTTLLAINAAEIVLSWFARRHGDASAAKSADYARALDEFQGLLPLGLSFLGGTALGAVAYITMGLVCLVLAILPIGFLALWCMRQA